MKRIVCFHSDVDFGVTTHLPRSLPSVYHTTEFITQRMTSLGAGGREGVVRGGPAGVRTTDDG